MGALIGSTKQGALVVMVLWQYTCAQFLHYLEHMENTVKLIIAPT